MAFPWEVDVQPGRFRREKDRKRYERLQSAFQGSRRYTYRKHGHPEWYSEYLKTDHWKRFKLRYRASGRPRRCMICNEARYELHHITYERVGEERLNDVVPLCRAHHLRAHAREKKGVDLKVAHLENAGMVKSVNTQR